MIVIILSERSVANTCEIGSRISPIILIFDSTSESKVEVTEPCREFSIGTTPYSQSFFATEVITASIVLKNLKSFSSKTVKAADSVYVPLGPKTATLSFSEKTIPLHTQSSIIRRNIALGYPFYSFLRKLSFSLFLLEFFDDFDVFFYRNDIGLPTKTCRYGRITTRTEV
jgi:hypothetical protein